MKLQKRAVYIFALFVALAMGLMMRVYVLTQDDTLRAAAQNQSTYLLHVDDSRGMIYDCNFYPLVNNQTSLQAAVVPTLEATQALMQLTQASERAGLLEQLQTLKPFLLPVASQDVYAKGIRVLETRQRYSSNMLASHVIGYVNADGDGVYGIEKACDELLKSYSGSLSVSCTVDAWGNAMSDSAIEVVDEDYLSQGRAAYH